jgi:hypothetical protein
MKQITKAEFKMLHKAGKLGLVASLFNHTKEQVSSKLTDIMQDTIRYSGSIPYRDVSRVDVNNQGEYAKTTIHANTLNPVNRDYSPVDFIYLETVIDNSKCDTCSMTDTQTDTIVYRRIMA